MTGSSWAQLNMNMDDSAVNRHKENITLNQLGDQMRESTIVIR